MKKSAWAKQDASAAGLIFLYCCLYAVLRLSVSSTMELDEAEQFLNGSFFSLGYAHQPPFYSWIVYGLSVPFGINIQTLIAVKYSILFFFYFSFYLIARRFWDAKASLLITGTLLFFPTYAYELHRDLSHSVLVATMASITCLLFVRLLGREKTSDYLLIGVAIGLGLLSKYNFAFFVTALLLAALSFPAGRRVLFNKRLFLSFVACVSIVSPHVLWLIQNGFLPFLHALTKAKPGVLQLTESGKIVHLIMTSYTGVLVFLVSVLFFLGFSSSWRNREHHPHEHLRFFRYLAVYGLTIPLLAMIVFRTEHFSDRWLTPLHFSIPLAVFSGIEMTAHARRFRILGYFCVLIAGAILIARAFVGFFPDLAGKVERIHTPFRHVSLQLKGELAERGINDYRELTIVTANEFLAANLLACLPGSQSYVTGDNRRTVMNTHQTRARVLIWDAGKQGEDIPREFAHEFQTARPHWLMRAPYLRSSHYPPFAMGAALVQ